VKKKVQKKKEARIAQFILDLDRFDPIPA